MVSPQACKWCVAPLTAELRDFLCSIETGKSADLIVLGENLFTVDRWSIHKIKPEAVIMEGELIHGALPEYSWPVLFVVNSPGKAHDQAIIGACAARIRFITASRRTAWK